MRDDTKNRSRGSEVTSSKVHPRVSTLAHQRSSRTGPASKWVHTFRDSLCFRKRLGTWEAVTVGLGGSKEKGRKSER